MDKKTISIIETIKFVIINQVGELIYPADKKPPDVFSQTSAYIKFLPITVCIEFMGACYDEQLFETPKLSEKRFNTALKELFDKKYHPYTKDANDLYFYKKLRSGMVHQLRPGKGLKFTTRSEATSANNPSSLFNASCTGNTSGTHILIDESAKENGSATLNSKTEHLKLNKEGELILILEDFYDDLKNAAERLIRMFETKKLTNKKVITLFLK